MSRHPIVHIELSTQDSAESAKFYGGLFGWKTQAVPEMNYTTFDTGEGSPGGGFNPLGEQVKAGDVSIYVGTDDIDAALAKVEALGGATVMPKSEIPNNGWFALFKDPTGNIVGLFTGTEQ